MYHSVSNTPKQKTYFLILQTGFLVGVYQREERIRRSKILIHEKKKSDDKFDKEITKNVNRFQTICRTIGTTLRRKTRKKTQIKFFNIMAVPTLTCGSE